MDSNVEWVEPKYNLVDIVAFEMKLEKRRRIEDFVIQFFKDWDSRDNSILLVSICEDLAKDRRLCNITQDSFKYTTLENFQSSFYTMCTELFTKGAEDVYIVSLLAFCVVLDDVMNKHIWYCSSLLFTSLIDVLEDNNFDTHKFERKWNHKDVFGGIMTSFAIVIPALLFFYIL